MDVVSDAKENRILRIKSTRSLPLETCRNDKALTEPENPLE